MSLRNGRWPWYAIQVRAGMERTATLYLENAGYQCFFPVAECARHTADRVEQFELPLFNGFLFCRMNPHHRLPVLQAPGVMQIAGAGETLTSVEEAEVSAMQRVTRSGLSVMPWPYLHVGHVVQMEEGPLSGLAGIVVKTKFGMKLVLSINMLQRSVAVEIDKSWIGANGHQTLLPMHKRLTAEHPSPTDSAHTQIG